MKMKPVLPREIIYSADIFIFHFQNTWLVSAM